MVYTSKAIEKETERQDVRCLYEELLKNATTEQKEKAYIAATAFLLGAQQKTAQEWSDIVEITVKGTSKEIADLVLQVQSQQTKVTSVNIANSNADDLVIEYNHKRHMSNCIGRC